MEAGLLNEIVYFIKPVTVKSDTGANSIEYQTVFSTRAQVYVDSGYRANEENEIFNGYTTTFTIRKYHVVDEYMIIQWKTKKYRIEYIIEDTTRQCLKIKT